MVGLLLAVAMTMHANAATFQVDDDGGQCPEAPYRTIQAAVDAAKAGDDITVCAGDYVERVYINKPLRLAGPRAGIDARVRTFTGSGEAVVRSPTPFALFTSDVTLDGFTIRVELDEDREGQGILAFGSGFRFINNLIDDDEVSGIIFATLGDNRSLVERNHFRGRFGIGADGEGAAQQLTVRENLFRNASIWLVDGPTAHVDILDNEFLYDEAAPTACQQLAQLECRPRIFLALTRDIRVERNRLTGSGPFAIYSLRNLRLALLNNTILDSQGDGILLRGESTEVIVRGNRIQRLAGAGLRLDEATGYLVERNVIEDNGAGVVLDLAHGNVLRSNVIEDNAGVGIDAQTRTRDNRMEANEVRGNAGPDCRDLSQGEASLGTANVWTLNEGSTSEPAGLCTDRPQ